jgi:hypothetical protein
MAFHTGGLESRQIGIVHVAGVLDMLRCAGPAGAEHDCNGRRGTTTDLQRGGGFGNQRGLVHGCECFKWSGPKLAGNSWPSVQVCFTPPGSAEMTSMSSSANSRSF